MTFDGIHGITPERFKEVLFKPDSTEIRNEIKDELKRRINTRPFKQFLEANKDSLGEEVIETIEMFAEKNQSNKGIADDLRDISQRGTWYAGIKPDDTLQTNITFDENAKKEWTNLERVWVGLNSIVGKKKDGVIIQEGTDPAVCNEKDVKKFVTRTFMEKREWAVQYEDGSWKVVPESLYNGINPKDVRLDKDGEWVK